ncbi:ATP-binding protein [Thalassotalea agarivorans]|uniref:histidine kinase n=1 Tax=Thalassotalea agarivorans TaxID=349064 RepID=A0A1I0GX39_THASX|nr:ATP-binding protein [Thalassotalea agarivorans]SET74906.1 two-component system, OmpR family, sensor kinase [Thalassotalea agarivorans]
MKLGRSFFSLYSLILLIFLIFSWLLDEVWNQFLEQDIESYTGYETMLEAVEDYLNRHPQVEWDSLVEKAGARYELPLQLINIAQLAELDEEKRLQLTSERSHVYFNGDYVSLFHVLEGTDLVIEMGPAKMPTRPRQQAYIRIGIFAVFGVVIFVWLLPLSRDLDRLQNATKEFGRGNFNTKAPKASSSMVAPMSRSFNMMSARIKRLIEAQKELTNAVAHELRTPLARSKFALQMLEISKDEEKCKKYIAQITQDVTDLDELINEMLLYASFESEVPELKFDDNNINDVVTKIVENYGHTEASIKVQSNVDNLMVYCDPHFIERAVHNYVSNAIKYGNGEVLVQVSQLGDKVHLSVEDNGAGVPDEFKPQIFDTFSRGDKSRNKETGGFGLGLAIVSRILEWHQGSVAVNDSEQLGGAKFEMSWPINRL